MTKHTARYAARSVAQFTRVSIVASLIAVAGARATSASAQTPVTTVAPTSHTSTDVKTVAPGDGTIDGTRVMAGKVVFAMSGAMNGQTMDLGTMTQETRRIDVGGKPALRVIQTTRGPMGTSTDTAIALLQTLAPLSLRGHSPDGALDVDFNGATLVGQRRDNGGNREVINQKLAQPAFDGGIIDVLVAALPLQASYAAKLPVYIFEQNGLVWCTVRVTGESAVAGTPVWTVSVEMPDGAERYSISKADHANLGAQFDAATGLRITMTRKSK